MKPKGCNGNEYVIYPDFNDKKSAFSYQSKKK